MCIALLDSCPILAILVAKKKSYLETNIRYRYSVQQKSLQELDTLVLHLIRSGRDSIRST